MRTIYPSQILPPTSCHVSDRDLTFLFFEDIWLVVFRVLKVDLAHQHTELLKRNRLVTRVMNLDTFSLEISNSEIKNRSLTSTLLLPISGEEDFSQQLNPKLSSTINFAEFIGALT
jgi:hypothetical protein